MMRRFESGFLLHLLTAANGTFRSFADVRAMSVVAGISDIQPRVLDGRDRPRTADTPSTSLLNSPHGEATKC